MNSFAILLHRRFTNFCLDRQLGRPSGSGRKRWPGIPAVESPRGGSQAAGTAIGDGIHCTRSGRRAGETQDLRLQEPGLPLL